MFEVRQIRKTHKNLRTMRELDSICFPEDPLPPVGLRKYHCFFAFEEGQVAGYAAGCQLRKYYFLARGGVVPEWRGRNLQQLLIKERIKKATSLGLNNVITYTSTNNISSIKNLKACGFEKWVDAPEWFKADEFLLWILQIEGASLPLNHFEP